MASVLSLPDLPPWAPQALALSSVCSERPHASWASLASFFQQLPDLSLFVQLVLSRLPYVYEFVPDVRAVSWLIGAAPGRPDMARCHGCCTAQPLAIAEAQLGVGAVRTWGAARGAHRGTGSLDFFLLIREECLTVCLEGQQILVERDRFWNQKIMTETLYLLTG